VSSKTASQFTSTINSGFASKTTSDAFQEKASTNDKNFLYYDTYGPVQWEEFEKNNGFKPGCMFPDCDKLVRKVWFREVFDATADEEAQYVYECIGAGCDDPGHVPAYDSPIVG
jgi:hypothetical protein